MAGIKDITGRVFGKLTVVSLLPARTSGGGTQWRCRCSCGNWSPCVRSGNLNNGHTTSCGCEQKRAAGKAKFKHGLARKSGNSHYTRWHNIRQRTCRQNHPAYHNYGGRGIKMYPGWFNNFIYFKKWLDDNLGPCPDGFTLDRIDVDGHYCPSNLRWATRKQQARNKR